MTASTAPLVPSEDRPPRKTKADYFTKRSRPSPTPPVLVIEKLRPDQPGQQSETVTLEVLAKELNVKDVERLRPLVDHHYLKMISAQEFLKDCVVLRPLPDGIRWLRNMLAPLALQPFVRFQDAVNLFTVKPDDLRTYCILYDVQITMDPAFGELIALRGFQRLYAYIFRYRRWWRTDRQALLQLFMSAEDKDPYRIRRNTPLGFSDIMEAEICRIIRMQEPARTMRAMDLWTAFKDAKSILHCVNLYCNPMTMRRVNSVAQKLERVIRTLVGTKAFKDDD